LYVFALLHSRHDCARGFFFCSSKTWLTVIRNYCTACCVDPKAITSSVSSGTAVCCGSALSQSFCTFLLRQLTCYSLISSRQCDQVYDLAFSLNMLGERLPTSSTSAESYIPSLAHWCLLTT